MSTSLAPASVSTWTIDPSHSTIEFAAKHLMITTVKGRLAVASGTITLDTEAPNASTVVVELDARSIDTRSEQRDGHLRTADFLDVDNHPMVAFTSHRIEGAAHEPGQRFRVVGDLTIRGVTREVALDATYEGRARDPWGGDRVSFSATTTIDRRDFGLTFNATLESGGVLVSNDVRLTLDVQATRN